VVLGGGTQPRGYTNAQVIVCRRDATRRGAAPECSAAREGEEEPLPRPPPLAYHAAHGLTESPTRAGRAERSEILSARKSETPLVPPLPTLARHRLFLPPPSPVSLLVSLVASCAQGDSPPPLSSICPQEGNARIMAAACPVFSLSLFLWYCSSPCSPALLALPSRPRAFVIRPLFAPRSAFSPGDERRGKKHHQREGKRKKNERGEREGCVASARREGPLYPGLTDFGLVGQFDCVAAGARARNLNPPTIGNRVQSPLLTVANYEALCARVVLLPPPPAARRPGIHG